MMKNNGKASVSKFFIVLGIGSAIFFGTYAYCLLARKLLSGTEFVAFTLGTFAFSFVVAFAGRVTEFSIAGNVVKLKEATEFAEAAYDKLNSAILGSFKVSLQAVCKPAGGPDCLGILYDSRVPNFISLIEIIENTDFSVQLKEEICTAAEDIMRGQIYKIHQSSPGVAKHTPNPYDSNFNLPDMRQLLLWHMDEESNNNNAIESIEYYGQLEEVRVRYARI